MKASCLTDTGKVRENNEDKVLMEPENGIFLLADGMGGGPGGEIASDLAVTEVHDFLRGKIADTDRGSLPRLLAEALASAHSAVFKRSLAEPALSGMGTTLEIVLVREGEAHICHVGDSRVYLMRDEKLRQVTTDDNLAALLMKEEHLPPEDIPPRARNILTQAVGASETLVPEILTLELYDKDLLLICSDGLTGMLDDRDIAGIVRTNRDDLDKAAGALVAAANAGGGFDNISVVLVAPEFPPHVPEETLLLAHRR